MSAGIKRPRENAQDDLPYGSDSDRSFSRRDVRRRDEGSHRDWRDAHLTSSRSHRDSDNHNRSTSDRNRGPNGERNSYVNNGQRLSPKGSRTYHDDHGNPNKRGPDSYSGHSSYRGKAYDKDRSSSNRRGHNDGDSRRRRSPLSHPTSVPSRGVSEGLSADKEEGEISPQLSHLAINSPAVPATPNRDDLTYLMEAAPVNSAIANKQEANLDTKETEKPVLEEDEELTAEQIIAERRARRQAILAKYAEESQGQSSSTPGPALSTNAQNAPVVLRGADAIASNAPSPNVDTSKIKLAGTGQDTTGIATPEETTSPVAFSLTKNDIRPDAVSTEAPPGDEAEQISAADYDPNQDRQEEEQRRVKALDQSIAMDVDPLEDEEIEVEEDEDDLDDMFAIADSSTKKVRRVKKSSAMPAKAAVTVDAAADPEGYYQIILGELLDSGRYQVFSSLGKGMFSAVVRARIVAGDKDEVGREVAIKIIRSQESMYKAGIKEVAILNKLMAADPEDKKHMIRLEKTFEHRGHLCIVFESLSMNLREIVKRFGKDVGLSMSAVRAYAQQIFLSLTLLKKCNIMHADIKPDNILVSENRAMLKLCDLGSASDVSENDIAPYLVSRFYRAPEIILGLPYDTALDMWSVGCTLYELYTGKILFPGRSNNHMLLLMMELKGRFNTKMIKRAKFGDVHFDDKGAFISVEPDKITGNTLTRSIFVQKPTRDLRVRLVPNSVAKANDDEAKILLSFVDLLDKCLSLDPAKRLTARDALIHPFIRGAV